MISVYKKLGATMINGDTGAYAELLHEDFVFFTEVLMNLVKKWFLIVKNIMSNEILVKASTRCLYENDEILVSHEFMSYTVGTSEVVMGGAKLKDHKIICFELGAT